MTDISFLGETPIARLKALMEALRADCPWDSQQSFDTIAPYTIEEAYEVAEAIRQDDMTALKEELGDLLFQVIFHSKMGDELGAFDFDAICDALTAKMVNRHPHVFGAKDERSPEQQTASWEVMKANERKAKGHDSLLADVALALPELMRAAKLQKRAARVGFDWPDLGGVFDKIDEEMNEVREAIRAADKDAMEDEIGDLIFAVTNLARKTGIDPEQALRRTNHKFTERFAHIERQAKIQKRDIAELSLDEMEALWQQAKQEKSS